MTRTRVLACALCAALSWPLAVLAQPRVPAAVLREARAAEDAANPELAARLYGELARDHGTTRFASIASRRLLWLKQRSEGDYQPLARLMVMRKASQTPDALVRFERDVRAFPSGVVRKEAWLYLSERWTQARHLERATAAMEALLREPGLSPAEQQNFRARLRSVTRPLSTRTREILQAIAWGALALFLLVAAAWGHRGFRVRTLRENLSLGALVALALIIGLPMWIARAYNPDAFDSFSSMAGGTLVVLAVAVCASTGIASRGRRAWLLLTALAAQGAVGLLVYPWGP